MNELEYYQVRHGVRTFTDFVYKRKDIDADNTNLVSKPYSSF